MDRLPDDAYEQDPEVTRRRYGSPPWWEQSRRPTLEVERVRNRHRTEAWRDGRGGDAPVLIRADVARALAALAFDIADLKDIPVEDVWLDHVADHVLATALGLDRDPPPDDAPADAEALDEAPDDDHP